MLDESQGGHLSINPLQTKSLIPFSKSSHAHTAGRSGRLRRWRREGDVFGGGYEERVPEPRALLLAQRSARPPAQLPAARRRCRCPRDTACPLVNKEMLNDCSSLIGYCRIHRDPDFTSQLMRKSDSPYRLMS